MENTLNSFQMPSYPLYPDIDWDKYMTPCSDVLHEILVVGSSEDIHFSKKCELSSDDITGVVWWAEVERDGFKEISNRIWFNNYSQLVFFNSNMFVLIFNHKNYSFLSGLFFLSDEQ